MCWQIAIPLLTSAAGAAVQNKAQQDLLGEKERIAADDARRNLELNREAGSRVNQEIQALTKSNPQAEEANANAGFMDALRRAKITGEGGVAAPGAASARFNDESGIAKTQGEAENANTANQFARIDAPMYQRQREGRALTDTAVDLDLMRGRGAGQDFLSQLRASMLRPNEALTAAGSLLSGFGQAYAGRAQPAQGYRLRTAPALANAFDTGGTPAFNSGGLA